MYYQHSSSRLAACPLTVHVLLHIADGIELIAPVFVYWAFGTERFCGKLQRSIKSRRYPFTNLDNQVACQNQLQIIINRYNLEDAVALKSPGNSWDYEIGDSSCKIYSCSELPLGSDPFNKIQITASCPLVGGFILHLFLRLRLALQPRL